MKKITSLIIGLFMSLSLFAQPNFDEISILQASFGMEKKEIVKSFIQISEDKSDAFWTLYEEYELKRKKNGKIRIELLTEYAQKWDSLQSEDADRMVLKSIDLNKNEDKLIAHYYKKIKKATSPDIAIKFYEVETYIRTTIKFYIKNTIPFVYQK